MDQFFWTNKALAESLRRSGRELEGKELLNTAQTAAFIEAIKIAIRRKTLSVIEDTIVERFVQDGKLLLDKKS